MNDDQEEIVPGSIPGNGSDENDRNHILAHFQEITNFYDVEQCFAILESYQWNLDQAVQSFFSGGGVTEQMEDDIEQIDYIPPVITGSAVPLTKTGQVSSGTSPFSIQNIMGEPLDPQGIFKTDTSISMGASSKFEAAIPSMTSQMDEFAFRSNQPNRLINFNIEYFQKKFTLHMPDNETILSLKELIFQEIDLPVKNQKLKGWKNKDAKVSDHMQLRELNLPLENNLFVINTNVKDDTSAVIYGTSNTKIDSFELNIQVMKNKSSTNQVTVINKSSSAGGASLAAHLETNTFKPASKENSSYHLHFEPNIKFIEIKRKIGMLTSLGVNEQEWWLFTKTQEQKDHVSQLTLEELIENGCLFNMPLTILIENDMKLIDLKILLDNLTETNTKVGASSTDTSLSGFTSIATSSNSVSKNSKLTPPNTNVLNMSFLVTQKKIEPSTNPISSTSNDTAMANKSNIDIEETIEEDDSHCELTDEDDLDDNFIMDTTPKHKPLIPSTCPTGDEVTGTTMFVEEFFKRYQPLIPIFFTGTLEDAIKEALSCPARERKLLGIYLHSDNSVCRHIFCSKTLCDENVVNFLAANFVVWPWDLTNKENEAHFYSTCSKYLGSVVTSHLRTNKIEFPAFLIVNRTRGTNEVIAVIEGTASNETMMHRLMQAFEMFETQRSSDARDENERDERELIKREQDAAYKESLELDKAKRQKQDEEQERLQKMAQEQESLEQQKIKAREMKIKNALDSLPAEPAADTAANTISKIRFRLPNGEMLQRKFSIENKLEIIFDYLTSNGYFSDEFKVLSSWPRRDLTAEDSERTLQELKLFPQETLTLEER